VNRPWGWQSVPVRRGARASVGHAPRRTAPIQSVPFASLADEIDLAPPCIFCNRPSGSVEHVWPEWLREFFRDLLGARATEPDRNDAALMRVLTELDQTIDCVCDSCSRGWMQRLDDNVRPFLTSMIIGDATPLPTGRQRLLARWAAKTSVVMECAYDVPARPPSFACDHLRRFGVPAGTQVLIGHYDGDTRLLTHERDLFSTTDDALKPCLSQSTFVMGKVLVQVFADPYRDSAPQLADDSSGALFALVPASGRKVTWPPDLSIDDAEYDLIRNGDSAPPRDDAEHEGPEVAFDELGHRDFDDEMADLLVDDADQGVALERWKDRLRRYVEQQGPLDALRLRSSSEPPWPAAENPMVGYLIERGTEIANHDGLDPAIAWVATNAWFEGVIAERARMQRLIDED
jgi:hypothetical protein